MKMILLAIGFLSMAATASAQETKYITGALLCDTQEQVEVVLTGIALNDGKMPDMIPEGCGQFRPTRPVPMTVTPLVVYETPYADALIGKFVYEPEQWTQYGVLSFNLKPKSPDPGEPA